MRTARQPPYRQMGPPQVVIVTTYPALTKVLAHTSTVVSTAQLSLRSPSQQAQTRYCHHSCFPHKETTVHLPSFYLLLKKAAST